MSAIWCRGLVGAGTYFLLTILIAVPAPASTQYTEAYFNGSSYVRLFTPISLQSHTGLSFRTCVGGELFAQHTNNISKVSLEVRADGLVFLAVLGGRTYESTLSARLLDNKWYYVNLLYRVTNITLSVAGHQQVVANSTYNYEILSTNLSGPGSVLIVGEKFTGCILQGPSIVFNSTEVKSENVIWGRCPMPTSGCSPCQQNGGNICRNGGRCEENEIGDYVCICNSGYTGKHCESELIVRPCDNNPCRHNGTCRTSALGDRYECSCIPGFTGTNCETNIDECASNPCQNGGTCIDGENSYTCLCGLTGYKGINCEENINECENNPCYNQGVCFDLYGSYTCKCTPGFEGQNCHVNVNECISNPCLNSGQCIDVIGSYECHCPVGFTGRHCEQNINDCEGVICPTNSVCVDGMNFHNCVCKPGFTGPNCQLINDACLSNPCQNGGTCSSSVNGYICNCTEYFMGDNCQLEYDACNSSPCQHNGTCLSQTNKREYTCECTQGYEGSRCETDTNDCISVTCPENRKCVDGINSFECQCSDGFFGENCTASVADVCAAMAVPCAVGASCVIDNGSPKCVCPPEYTGEHCETDVDECKNPGICNNGICQNVPGSYECYCKPGFVGVHCDFDVNECLSQPCLNGGECLNLINNFSCICAPGYTGEICQHDIDECASDPCLNGATCINERASFTCQCLAGYTGVICDTNIDECQSSPCLNDGVCIDGVNSYTCNCNNTGYEGELCEVNIDECRTNPCVNGGHCKDHVKNYTCDCYPGYTGSNCEIDINECESNPCQYGGTCLQHSNISLYMNENSINGDSYIPEVFKKEFSHASASGYECLCVPGILGTNCETNFNECDSNPCLAGSCVDKVGGYVCECEEGFTGVHCETDIDECEAQPCVNGICTDGRASYDCKCDVNFGGKNCSVPLIGCHDGPCRNNGSCTAYLVNETEHKFNCTCPAGFHGSRCEKHTTMSMSGSSYATVTTSRDEGYDIQFRFKTTLENGVLAIGQGTTYYVLKLSQGRLNLHSSLLNKWDGVYMGSNLNNGTWQRVFVAINATHLVLASNDEQTIYPINLSEGANSSQTSFSTTWVGGPVSLASRVVQAPITKFVGCMEDVVVNGVWVLQDVNTTSLALKFSDVDQGCPRIEQCSPNPCLNGGECTDVWRDFECQCQRPYLGHTCQYNWTAATFCYENITNSIVKVLVNDIARRAIRNVIDISMFIRTRQKKGDIFYMGTEPGSVPATSETLIVAEMDDGELVVRIQFNNSVESYNVPGVKLADGNNHLIQVVRNITLVEVKINGTEFFRKTVITSGQLDVQVLYLGGVPAFVRQTRQAMEPAAMRVYRPTGINFKGVIQDVEISNGSRLMVVEFFPLNVDDIIEIPSFGTVSFDPETVLEGVVSDDACQSNPCLHNGTCYVTWNDYGCMCPRGYKGKMCHEMEFCQLQDCPEGSTCRNLEDGYECIANITLEGHNTSLSYTFNQRDIERYTDLNIYGVEINYRSQTGGTILYIGNPDSHHFSVSVYRDQVWVSWLLDDPTKSGSYKFGKPQPDGNWTKVVFDMKNGLIAGGFREMDEDLKQMMVANFSAQSWYKLLYEAAIMIGAGEELQEVSVLDTHAYHTFSTDSATLHPLDNSMVDFPVPMATTVAPVTYWVGGPFKGCLGEIRIGSSLLPYFALEQLNAENLTSRDFLYLSAPLQQVDLGCELCFNYECKNGGWCESPKELYSCKCPIGFEGIDCSSDINECATNECMNNATCKDEIGKYSCLCVPGWTGQWCENEINECDSNPCQNNGTCIDGKGMFECNCTDEFMGRHCEYYKLITCENMPCKNGSTCTDVKNEKTGDNFTCTCAAGFEGVYCDLAYCLAKPCENGATCNLSGMVPFCQCVAGYTGKYCETDINECIVGPDNKSPCMNGGMCIDGLNKFTCDCSGTGYEGQTCEEDIDECVMSTVYCGRGTCLNRQGSYTCKCDSGKCGIHCNFTDPCEEKPCKNGGTCNEFCVESPDKYACICMAGFAGINCTEKPVGAAASGADIAVIVAPIVGIVLLAAAVGLFVFVRMARKKRATRGTYSPSQQEYCNPRVEMDNVLKPPPEERLI